MSFFDEGDDPETSIRTERPAPRRTLPRRPSVDDRTLLVRRAVAALLMVVIVVLVVFGVKAILDRQATQSLRDYVTSDLTPTVNGEQSSVRLGFFQNLDNAYNAVNPLVVPTNIQQYVQQEQTYYREAQAWSVPAQMVAAQRQYVEVLGMRYEALQKIDNALPGALGTGNQAPAITSIAGAMQLLLASDVIYATRVKPLVAQALGAAGIVGVPVPDSPFLPDLRWLYPQSAAQLILGYVPSELGGAPLGGSADQTLTGVYADHYGPVSATAVNEYTLGSQGITFELQLRNTGTVSVHDVITEILFHAAGLDVSCLTRSNVIRLTPAPGGTYSSPIVIAPTLTCRSFVGHALTMTAYVKAGQSVSKQHYTVVFH